MRHSARLVSIPAAAVVALGLIGFAGCGGGSDNLPREAVSGSVAVNGKPIKTGIITFLPSGDTPTQGGSAITEGKYAIPREQGLVPGTYKVVVSSGEGTEEKKTDTNAMPGMPPVPAKEAIPSDYNAKSLLTAEVKAGGKNVFEFNITSVPGKGR